ncbi:DsbA family protein [Paraburkholderia sp. Ac-20342]|uniref:DsbA family protein n=1 Tax=Paraburkholderia sp. Ac-20342 TaxID=2703889 RepID=UPI00197D6C94|nr:thioredoxin domain-containing protein [Paraburkholderia sp. Ac-20342]MBN3849441.1 DsbA family protein [Paraburkholderia sp. Ac-20342]
MPRYLFIRRRRRGLLAMLSLAVLVGAGGALLLSSRQQQADSPATLAVAASGPPWIYGKSSARFTLVAFADFECPYCQTTIPRLLRWVQENPDVALQWHHLPLPAHEPMASQEASLAECRGQVAGSAAFWDTVVWIYAHTRGNGQGPAESPPNSGAGMQACLASGRAAEVVRSQADAATDEGITATPTLRLLDRETGRSLKLEGAVDEDVLLSALDWLSLPPDTVEGTEVGSAKTPAADAGEIPR